MTTRTCTATIVEPKPERSLGLILTRPKKEASTRRKVVSRHVQAIPVKAKTETTVPKGTFHIWCSECARARRTEEQHRRRGGARDICVFSFDYLHFDKSGIPVAREAVLAGAGVSLTILVAKGSKGKVVFGHVVQQKVVDPHHFAVDILMKDIDWLSYTAHFVEIG